MKTLRIFFWVNTVVFTIALFIALAAGNYSAVIWISLCMFYHTIHWDQTKHNDEQEKLLDEWRGLAFEYRELAGRAIAETQEAYATAFRLAMLLDIDNEITE